MKKQLKRLKLQVVFPQLEREFANSMYGFPPQRAAISPPLFLTAQMFEVEESFALRTIWTASLVLKNVWGGGRGSLANGFRWP